MKRILFTLAILVASLGFRASASLPDGGITWQELRDQQIRAANTLPDGGQKPNPYVHKLSDGGTYFGVLLPDGGVPVRTPYVPPARINCVVQLPATDGGVPNCRTGFKGDVVPLNLGQTTTSVPRCCPTK